jgi:hypothetical protein
MANTDLVCDDHRIADTAVFPEVYIRSTTAHIHESLFNELLNPICNPTHPQIPVAFTWTNTCPGPGLPLGFSTRWISCAGL